MTYVNSPPNLNESLPESNQPSPLRGPEPDFRRRPALPGVRHPLPSKRAGRPKSALWPGRWRRSSAPGTSTAKSWPPSPSSKRRAWMMLRRSWRGIWRDTWARHGGCRDCGLSRSGEGRDESMSTVRLEIPEETLISLKTDAESFDRDLKMLAAVKLSN